MMIGVSIFIFIVVMVLCLFIRFYAIKPNDPTEVTTEVTPEDVAPQKVTESPDNVHRAVGDTGEDINTDVPQKGIQ